MSRDDVVVFPGVFPLGTDAYMGPERLDGGSLLDADDDAFDEEGRVRGEPSRPEDLIICRIREHIGLIQAAAYESSCWKYVELSCNAPNLKEVHTFYSERSAGFRFDGDDASRRRKPALRSL